VFQIDFCHAFDQAGLLVLVGCFMCLEAECALGNISQLAGWETMNLVVETSAFEQKDWRKSRM
jgi:hypothetical protein